MKTTTRRPRQRLNERLGDYNARLREWLETTNAHRYALQQANYGGELTEKEINRNLEAFAARIAEEPLPSPHLAPSYGKPSSGDDTPEQPIKLGYLLSQITALTARVVDLEKLVASTVAYRSLKASAKARVDRIDPSVGAAFKDKRTLLALTIYDHVANMGGKKKSAANFPKDLRDEIVDYSGETPDRVCRVIPYTALMHRLAAKKDFRPSADERSSQENARIAIDKSGLIVTTMHEAGIRNGSALLVVMDRVEAEKRGLVKRLKPIEDLGLTVIKQPTMSMIGLSKPHPDAPKKGNPRFSGWDEQEDTSTVPDGVLTDTTDTVDEDLEPTTTDTVDDDEVVDESEWEEEEEQPEEGFALFRTPEEEPKKSNKIIDLFAD